MAGRVVHAPAQLVTDALGRGVQGLRRPGVRRDEIRPALRYGELRRRMPDVSEKMLVQRVRELESDGLVARHDLGTRQSPHVDYHLTDEGRTLIPVLESLHAWGTARALRTHTPVDAPPTS